MRYHIHTYHLPKHLPKHDRLKAAQTPSRLQLFNSSDSSLKSRVSSRKSQVSSRKLSQVLLDTTMIWPGKTSEFERERPSLAELTSPIA